MSKVNNMKRLFLSFALVLCALSVSAQAIRSLDVEVYINDEGDAFVQQFWDVTVVRGTEWYIPIGNLLPGMSVRGLKVYENGEQFIDEGRTWDSDRSLAQKAGRSGIIDKGKDGVELCWGQGAMGDHKWKVTYIVLGLVQALEDYDAFNYMFVNPGMIAGPEKVSVTFYRLSEKPFNTDYARFWFFGTEGNSEVMEDGSIRFETSRPMKQKESVICMMRFEKGEFSPENSRDMKFEKMQKKAFKGSDYNKKSSLFSNFSTDDLIDMFFELLIFLVALGSALLFAVLWIKDQILKLIGRPWSAKTFGDTRITGWAREAPFEGSIPIASFLLKDGSRLTFKNNHPERAIGAYFLKWIQEGLVTPVKAADGHFDVQFPSELPDFSDTCETNLFRKSMEAAGSNLILEKGEFDSWAKKHYKAMLGWPDSVVNLGKSKLSGWRGDKVAEAANLLKFKNFLNDFTLSKVREVPEVGMWGQYLVFAQLFGIADKVAKGFAKMYPTEFTEYSSRYGLDSNSMCYVVNSWSSMTSRAYSKAYSEKLSQEASSRSSSRGGFGGGSSIGGGGGFSGGGFGGGSR